MAQIAGPDRFVAGPGPSAEGFYLSNLRNRVLEPVPQTLELPQLSWHTFRYTHATWLSESQVSARTAQSILGHADVSMTLNFYTQAVEESQRIAVEKIAAVLDPNGPKFGDKLSGEKTDGPLIQ